MKALSRRGDEEAGEQQMLLPRRPTKPPISRIVAAAGIVLGFIAAAILLALWAASGDLAAPARRPLQGQQRDLLGHPAVRGLSVLKFSCLQGTSACLLVEPDPGTGPTARQRQLRAQLRYRGLALPVYGDAHGTLILLHARRGRKEDLLPVAERFVAAGFRCVIPDLPAHGESSIPTTKFAADRIESKLPAQLLWEARRKFALPSEPAGLWGLSTGAAYAIRAAADSPQLWGSLIVVSGFDSLDGVLQDRLVGWVGPLAPRAAVMLERVVAARGGARVTAVRPLAWAAGVSAPALVVHGDADELIDIDRARRLFDAFGAEKRFVAVPGARHGNVLSTDMPLYATMAEWFARTLEQSREGRSDHAAYVRTAVGATRDR
jgi:alpha-beta hydrolase superfamily lysophospholipase